jgi:hypothetical protein
VSGGGHAAEREWAARPRGVEDTTARPQRRCGSPAARAKGSSAMKERAASPADGGGAIAGRGGVRENACCLVARVALMVQGNRGRKQTDRRERALFARKDRVGENLPSFNPAIGSIASDITHWTFKELPRRPEGPPRLPQRLLRCLRRPSRTLPPSREACPRFLVQVGRAFRPHPS